MQQLLQNTDTAPGVAGDLQIAALLDDTAKLLFSKGHFSDAANQYRCGTNPAWKSPVHCRSNGVKHLGQL